jgi:hypothetical protein
MNGFLDGLISLALSQAAALIELDVDDIEAAYQPRQIPDSLRAFVSRNRDGKAKPFELRFATDVKGLLMSVAPYPHPRRYPRRFQ